MRLDEFPDFLYRRIILFGIGRFGCRLFFLCRRLCLPGIQLVVNLFENLDNLRVFDGLYQVVPHTEAHGLLCVVKIPVTAQDDQAGIRMPS